MRTYNVSVLVYVYKQALTSGERRDSTERAHRSRSRVGHLAGELRPLVLRPLLVQKVSLEGPDDVLHAVDAHRRPVENIAVVSERQETKRKASPSSQSETFRLSFQRRSELKENRKKWVAKRSRCRKLNIGSCVQSSESARPFIVRVLITPRSAVPSTRRGRAATYPSSPVSITVKSLAALPMTWRFHLRLLEREQLVVPHSDREGGASVFAVRWSS